MLEPTDEELTTWHAFYFGCEVYDADTIPALRAAVCAKTFEEAEKVLLDAGYRANAVGKIAHALREVFAVPE